MESMQMPVAVGVIVAVIFLIAFSGWFYHLASGWSEYVIDDAFFKYRIIFASVISILIISGTFFGMAYAYECPNEEREGVFASLNCAEYRNIKVGAEALLKKTNIKQEEPAQSIDEQGGRYIFDSEQ